MTEIIRCGGVCLPCCPSASTPTVTHLLVRYCYTSAAVGSLRVLVQGFALLAASVVRGSSGVYIDSKMLLQEVGVVEGGP
jgi:hypothetical protein